MTIPIRHLTEPDVKTEAWLRKDPIRNGFLLYDLTLGFDLCDWFVTYKKDRPQACLVAYKGDPNIASVFTRGDPSEVKLLLDQIQYSAIFAFIPKDHQALLQTKYSFSDLGEFWLMSADRYSFAEIETLPVHPLSKQHLEEVDSFLRMHGEGAWHQRQLDLGPYYCMRKGNEIISICGTLSVYPDTPSVAVIGNLFTIPQYRQRGYGTAVFYAVVSTLLKSYRFVTLYVRAENKGAIKLYQRLGFEFYEAFFIGQGKRH